MSAPNLTGVPQTDRGPWMQTWLGGRFYPLDPRPEDIDPRDIAQALSFQNRFNGHTAVPFSIAQHSIVGADLAMAEHGSVELAAIMLMHDAPEAYLGDMNRPLKSIVPQYREIEAATWRAVALRFGLPLVLPKAAKVLDERLLAMEKTLLLPHAEPWPGVPHVEWKSLQTWPTHALVPTFMDRFAMLFPDDPTLQAPH